MNANNNTTLLNLVIRGLIKDTGLTTLKVVDKAVGGPDRWVVETPNGDFRFGEVKNFFFTEDGYISSTPDKFKTGIEVKINLKFFFGLKTAVTRVEKKMEELRAEVGGKKSPVGTKNSFIRKEIKDNIVTIRFDGEYLRILATGYLELLEPMVDGALAIVKIGFFQRFKGAGEKMEGQLKLREQELTAGAPDTQSDSFKELDRKIRAQEVANNMRELHRSHVDYLNRHQ